MTVNKGYDSAEIELLKEDCRKEGRAFVYVDDEEVEVLNSGECAHIQFVGQYQGTEVIFDAILYTLRLHHSSLVYEQAMESVKQAFPQYLSPEERTAGYQIDSDLEEEIELYMTELIEEIEETEAIKVQEHLEVDTGFVYGIGLDVCLNVEEITDEVIEHFIRTHNDNALQLDNTLYSFVSNEHEN